MSSRRNGNRARCQFDGCEKFAQTRGLCKAHGGGSRCRDTSCNKLAQSRGLCIAHGGGRRCQHEGCSKLAQSKGFCISHGGGRRCTVPNCEKFSQVKGRCKSHSKLAESSDQDVDDEETDVEPMTSEPMVERFMASPQQDHSRQVHGYAQAHRRIHSPPSPLKSNDHDRSTKPRIDYMLNPLARIQQQHRAQDAVRLPPPQSLGLIRPLQSLLPPPSMMLTVGNQERAPQPSDFDFDMEDTVARRATMHRALDPFKRVPIINPRFQEEELRPLPYAYQLPSRPIFSNSMEEIKQESHSPPHGYALLPSSFVQARPSRTVPVAQHGHFTSHSHSEPTIQPTSISLLSFLNRTEDEYSRHLPSTSSSSVAAVASVSSTNTNAEFKTVKDTTASLPSIMLPPLKHIHQSQP